MQIVGFVVLAFLFIYFWPASLIFILAAGALFVVLYKGSATKTRDANSQLHDWRNTLKKELGAATIAENARWTIGWNDELKSLALVEHSGAGKWIPAWQIRALELEPHYSQHHESTSQTRTSRGSQLVGAGVGAALAGPAGLVVGGLSGNTTTDSFGFSEQYLDSLTIKLRLDSTDQPLLNLGFSRDLHEVEIIAAHIQNALEDRPRRPKQSPDALKPFAVTPRPVVDAGWWSKTFG